MQAPEFRPSTPLDTVVNAPEFVPGSSWRSESLNSTGGLESHLLWQVQFALGQAAVTPCLPANHPYGRLRELLFLPTERLTTQMSD